MIMKHLLRILALCALVALTGCQTSGNDPLPLDYYDSASPAAPAAGTADTSPLPLEYYD